MEMTMFKNPSWILVNNFNLKYGDLKDIPDREFQELNKLLTENRGEHPVVSIVIPTMNEERNILNCIASLANMESTYHYEIVVVNNNSTDRTQTILDKLNIRSFFQPIQGCGPARQLGQEQALGSFVLMADADCIYPKSWLNTMMKSLTKPGVSCVYGRYSFIGEKNYPRWILFFYECLRSVIAEIRHVNRPYLNAYGMSMGYIKEYGLRVGFVGHNIRGEDGRMCFDLMKYGRVLQVKATKARVWTGPRTLKNEGSIGRLLFVRIKIELSRFFSFFYPHLPHDTKTSKN